MEQVKILTLVANDNTKVKIDSKSAKKSSLLLDITQDFTHDEEINLNVSGESLLHIVDYLIHFRDFSDNQIKSCPKPFPHKDIDFIDLVDSWSYNFVKNKSYEENINLVVAAEYMRINSLHDLLCSYGASLINLMNSSDDIMKFYQIQEDLTAESLKTLEQEEMDKIKKKVAQDRELESKIFE